MKKRCSGSSTILRKQHLIPSRRIASGYENWCLLDGSWALDPLNAFAVAGHVVASHDAVAASARVHDGRCDCEVHCCNSTSVAADMMQQLARMIGRWMRRTPVQTFVLCPLVVIAVATVVHGGHLIMVPWGAVPLIWGYLQYRLVGRYRRVMAGGGPGMQTLPERIIDTGPYRYTRNPMYLGHLIFLMGLAIMFWSIYGLVLFAARGVWFHRRVLHDEKRLHARFGSEYADYQNRTRRWIPGTI